MNNIIITINDNSNYGNRLQNYALSRYLNINFNNADCKNKLHIFPNQIA